MREARVFAPAKINLGLDVRGRLDNGYHSIDTVFMSINLQDELILSTRCDNDILIECNHPDVPLGEDNIAYWAARLIQDYGGLRGVTISIKKNIPIAGGLAGGSADAAAILRTLPQLWGIDVPRQQLHHWANSLGADVAFCLIGGTQRGQGIGTDLIRIEHECEFNVAILPQPFAVRTADVYRGWNRTFPQTHCDIDLIINDLKQCNFSGLVEHMSNSLETVTFSMHPELKQKKQMLIEQGVPTLMSGSGPTLFCIFDKHEQQERIEALFPDQAIFCRTINCTFDQSSERIIKG